MTPQTPAERAKQLARDHWGYIEATLAVHGVEREELDIIGHHYTTAMIHGYKHGVDDTRHGYPVPAMTAERYTEIHTPLPDDLVAKLAEWPCVEPAKEPALKTCATCAETGCCNTGRTLSGCSLHTPLSPEEVEEISKEVANTPPICASCARGSAECDNAGETVKWCGWYYSRSIGKQSANPEDATETSLCDSCAKGDVSCPIYPQETQTCGQYSSNLREQIAEAKDVTDTNVGDMPLDLSLPSITLEGDKDAVWAKYKEELEEYQKEPQGSMSELVESWDCLQALQTHRERGGHSPETEGSRRQDLEFCHRKGRPVMKAKAAMLLKNATRPNPSGGTGYYSPETCAIIIANNGERWQ